MSKKARENRKAAAVSTPPRVSWWPYAIGGVVALILAFWAYGPSLNGQFMFDDTALPFALPNFQSPLIYWLKADVRPVLFTTYYFNAQISKDDPNSYHVLNVIIHLLATVLIFVVVRRLLELRRKVFPESVTPGPDDHLLAAFAAALFLLHPVQSEAVAYIAGRSESLSAMFGLAAFAVFLYRKQRAASWGVAVAVLLLFGLALGSKQNAIALPALLLLTDYWWNPGFSLEGIRNNWKLYAPMVAGALVGVALFWRVIMTAQTAGFGMKDLTWYQYFFTQCRALFVYIGMFLLPARLTADWDFSISHNVLDHGAIIGLLALLGLAAAAWRFRRRFPLASFGYFAFLLMMAPTSSILPIRDPIAERRLYSAMIGLLLIAVDLLSRVRVERKVLVGACAVVALVAGVATRARAAVWSDSMALWQDTAQKAPNKSRVRFHLGYEYFSSNPPDYRRAIDEFERAAAIDKPDYNLLIDWGLAYDGLNRTDDALAKFRQAAMMEPKAHVYTQIAYVYAKHDRWSEALDALATAEKLDGTFAPIYVYRAEIYLKTGRCMEAYNEAQRALRLEPGNQKAQSDVQVAVRCLQAASH